MSLLTIIYFGILPLLAVAISFALVRVLRGPSLADRVISLELLATFGVGVVGVYAIATQQPAMLDVALVFALLVFLSTVGFAFYIQQRAQLRNRKDSEF